MNMVKCGECQKGYDEIRCFEEAIIEAEGKETYLRWIQQNKERAEKDYTEDELLDHKLVWHESVGFDNTDWFEQQPTYKELFGRRRI